jgi:hypothetical protein
MIKFYYAHCGQKVSASENDVQADSSGMAKVRCVWFLAAYQLPVHLGETLSNRKEFKECLGYSKK